MAAVVAALLLSTVGSGTAAAKETTGDPRRLQAALDELRDLGAAGAQGQVSAGRRETAARSGVADLASGAPMPVAGAFRIGSDTKTFVSVVVLQLAGERRLSLDDSVERWLPGTVAGNGNDGRRVTVRQLLQHTSGIANYTGDMAALGSQEGFLAHRFDHYEPAELVALAMRHRPAFEPGTHWDYSNTNYVLAGMVVKAVTGQSWAEQVHRRIVGPLGMRGTFFPGDRAALPGRAARSYQQFAPGGDLVDVTEFNATAADAAGGLVSTTADLNRFWRALQDGRLLRPAQQAELHRTVLAETYQDVRRGLRYGLGIFEVPTACGRYWGHPGDVPGTSTFNGVDDAGRTAVVVYRTTGLADPVKGGAMDARVMRLVDDVMCG
ncbi:beta-lactamase family protein [Dactylosporangium sp. NBC_01737]|uniref:serine hydrolase domain-containing protein n=1 Tax=Dactylosporangium sp. NBC_01737 TaxID=2975959 RepID=UPI002E12DA35|nr:beta-lactamase family protein [Dactylosporangium sp. NBC_01737]